MRLELDALGAVDERVLGVTLGQVPVFFLDSFFTENSKSASRPRAVFPPRFLFLETFPPLVRMGSFFHVRGLCADTARSGVSARAQSLTGDSTLARDASFFAFATTKMRTQRSRDDLVYLLADRVYLTKESVPPRHTERQHFLFRFLRGTGTRPSGSNRTCAPNR